MKITKMGMVLSGILCFFAGTLVAEMKYPTRTDSELTNLIEK